MGFDQGNIDDLLADAGIGGDDSGGGADDIMSQLSGGDDDGGAATADPGQAQPAKFEAFDPNENLEATSGTIEDLLGDVKLKVKVILGQATMSVEDILRLNAGSVIELDKLAGDPLDILVNDRLVAKGEVLVLNENFCIRITDIIPPDDRT